MSFPPAEDQFFSSWAWWYRSIISALWRLRQEACHEFEASLSFHSEFLEGDLLGEFYVWFWRTCWLPSSWESFKWQFLGLVVTENPTKLSILIPAKPLISVLFSVKCPVLTATENWPHCTPALRQGDLLRCRGLTLPGDLCFHSDIVSPYQMLPLSNWDLAAKNVAPMSTEGHSTAVLLLSVRDPQRHCGSDGKRGPDQKLLHFNSQSRCFLCHEPHKLDDHLCRQS